MAGTFCYLNVASRAGRDSLWKEGIWGLNYITNFLGT